MASSSEYSHISITGVHPGFVKTNIWVSSEQRSAEERKTSWIEKSLRFLLDWYAVDSQQGSLAITNAATAGGGAGGYWNRIWEAVPMPQTRNVNCRRKVWEFVNDELKLEEGLLLVELGG